MIPELKRLTKISKALHYRALEKQSGLLGGAMRVGGKVVATAAAHPLKTLALVGGGLAAAGKARSTYNNMRPEVLRHQLGMEQ